MRDVEMAKPSVDINTTTLENVSQGIFILVMYDRIVKLHALRSTTDLGLWCRIILPLCLSSYKSVNHPV
jgi:hypothetical protein